MSLLEWCGNYIRITSSYIYTNGMEDDEDANSVAFVIAFLICVHLSKEPEYTCEYCDKVYKQEARYKAHMKTCVEKVTGVGVGAAPEKLDNTTVMELLRQNAEMMDLLRKQQETIQMLVMERSIHSFERI
jgi:hypothetical protein